MDKDVYIHHKKQWNFAICTDMNGLAGYYAKWNKTKTNTVWYHLYAKLLQSCLTLCNPTDGSPAGSPIPGILQARILEWVAISFTNTWKWKVKVKSLSLVRLLATPWTAAHQAPPSVGFSRQEYWTGMPLPSPHLALYQQTKSNLGCLFL